MKGIYYWNNAQRIDEITIKIETSDDEQTTSIITKGGKEDLERFAMKLNLSEKGKVYIKGIFENNNNNNNNNNEIINNKSLNVKLNENINEKINENIVI